MLQVPLSEIPFSHNIQAHGDATPPTESDSEVEVHEYIETEDGTAEETSSSSSSSAGEIPIRYSNRHAVAHQVSLLDPATIVYLDP